MRPPQIRLLTVEDAVAYRSLMLEAYAQDPDAFTSTAEERAAEPDSYWARRIADPAGRGLALGAFDASGELVGSVALEFEHKPKTRHKALLIGMYLRPAARRQGAGRALVEALLALAAQRPGVCRVVLTVTEGNEAAIALYLACGFEAYGLEPMAIRTADGRLLGKCLMGLTLAR